MSLREGGVYSGLNIDIVSLKTSLSATLKGMLQAKKNLAICSSRDVLMLQLVWTASDVQ